MFYGVKKEERETIIVFNEADGEASIYTFNTDLKKRLSAFARRFPQLARLDRVFPEGVVEYVIDKDHLSIGSPLHTVRNVEKRQVSMPGSIASWLSVKNCR